MQLVMVCEMGIDWFLRLMWKKAEFGLRVTRVWVYLPDCIDWIRVWIVGLIWVFGIRVV